MALILVKLKRLTLSRHKNAAVVKKKKKCTDVKLKKSNIMPHSYIYFEKKDTSLPRSALQKSQDSWSRRMYRQSSKTECFPDPLNGGQITVTDQDFHIICFRNVFFKYINSKPEYVGLLQDARDKRKRYSNLLNTFRSSVYTKEKSGADVQRKMVIKRI